MKTNAIKGTAAVLAMACLLAACSETPESAAPATAETTVPAPTTATPAPAATPSTAPTESTSASPTLAVEAEGLRLFSQPSGSATPIPFGQGEDQVLAALERVRGPAARGTNENCGAGPVQYANWADGLSIVSQNGRFVGWSLDGRAAGAVQTADGVGPGTTRAELESAFGNIAFSQTSLGTEFAAGDVYGLLDGAGPASKVSDMWAGTSCVAR